MTPRANRLITAAAFVCLMAGIALSHLVESGVRVESVTLANDTPAIRFVPSESGPHPVALLAHGVTASKETLFRLGEALAMVGFECFAVDLPGHGASPHPFSFRRMTGALGSPNGTTSVDIFVGHSMGAYVGSMAVREGALKPRLFISVGAGPRLGTEGPPLLLLAGEWEEAVPANWLKERTDARLMLFPWCDHAWEPFHPPLVNAAVEAACTAVGRTAPSASPTRWIWRAFGLVMGMAGALVLAFRLPTLPEKWAALRGPLVAIGIITSFALMAGTWVGAAPHLHRLPVQLAIAAFAWLAIWGLGRLRVPRWGFTAGMVVITILFVVIGAYFFALITGIGALVFFAGRVIGWLASHSGLPRDEEIATAIIIGYAFGQLMPMPF